MGAPGKENSGPYRQSSLPAGDPGLQGASALSLGEIKLEDSGDPHAGHMGLPYSMVGDERGSQALPTPGPPGTLPQPHKHRRPAQESQALLVLSASLEADPLRDLETPAGRSQDRQE